jgi:hypothetical protein
MDDDKFRSYRDRDPVAREAPEQFSRGALRDLLVELARLTGQGDPNVSRDGGSSGLDWAADDAAPEQHQLGKKHHVPEPSARSSRLRPAEMIGGQFLPQAPTLLLTASDDRHEGDIQPARGPSRRNGLVMAIAVLGLVVLGAVGAFANRAVFGGPGLASPPKAENEPNKLDPNSQPSNLSQASIASAGSDEKFASRWPADNQEQPPTAPISSNPSASLTSGAVVPIATELAGPPLAIATLALTAASVPLTPAPLPPSWEPKKIHAVTMRPDGLEQNDTSAAAAPHSVTSGRAPGVKPSAGPALAGRNQPLSLVPDAQGHVEARPRTGAVSKNRTEDSVQDHNSK